MTHLWPSISPWNVWGLPYWMWLGYAAACDDYASRMKETS